MCTYGHASNKRYGNTDHSENDIAWLEANYQCVNNYTVKVKTSSFEKETLQMECVSRKAQSISSVVGILFSSFSHGKLLLSSYMCLSPLAIIVRLPRQSRKPHGIEFV